MTRMDELSRCFILRCNDQKSSTFLQRISRLQVIRSFHWESIRFAAQTSRLMAGLIWQGTWKVTWQLTWQRYPTGIIDFGSGVLRPAMLLSTANSDQCRIIAEEGRLVSSSEKAASRFDQEVKARS